MRMILSELSSEHDSGLRPSQVYQDNIFKLGSLSPDLLPMDSVIQLLETNLVQSDLGIEILFLLLVLIMIMFTHH